MKELNFIAKKLVRAMLAFDKMDSGMVMLKEMITPQKILLHFKKTDEGGDIKKQGRAIKRKCLVELKNEDFTLKLVDFRRAKAKKSFFMDNSLKYSALLEKQNNHY